MLFHVPTQDFAIDVSEIPGGVHQWFEHDKAGQANFEMAVGVGEREELRAMNKRAMAHVGGMMEDAIQHLQEVVVLAFDTSALAATFDYQFQRDMEQAKATPGWFIEPEEYSFDRMINTSMEEHPSPEPVHYESPWPFLLSEEPEKGPQLRLAA